MNRKILLPEIDATRGIAILAVWIFHCLTEAQHLPWGQWVRSFQTSWFCLAATPVNFGWLGVAVFFVVSGFCIQLSFQTQGGNWKAFFIRRWFRLYPPFFGALLLFAFIIPQTAKVFWGRSPVRDLGAHAFLAHNLWADTYYQINGSFWSIAIECQLYLLFPLVYWGVNRLGWRAVLGLTLASEAGINLLQGYDTCVVAYGSAVGHPADPGWLAWWSHTHWLFRSPFAYWYSWCLGAKLADDYLNQRPLLLQNRSPGWWLAGLLVCFFIRPLYGFTFLFTALLTTGVLARALMHPSSPAAPGWLGGSLQSV